MRNRIIQILLLLCCLPIQTGCIGEDDFADDPVGNFEQLWKIIDERYCFLDSKGIDWDAVHEKYSKLIVPGMSNDDLFDKLSEMLYILKDGHVNLSSAKRVSYYDAWYQGYPWNYREDILYQYYLGSASKDYYTSAGMKYKIFDNNIGYIRYESFSSGVGDGNLDEILVYLATCNGLIIDVRDNGGGNLTNSSRIAARFTNNKILTGYIQHKTGTGHSDFSKPEPIYLEPSNIIENPAAKSSQPRPKGKAPKIHRQTTGGFHAVSNTRAAALASSVICSPASIRAISSNRAVLSSS